MIEILESRLLCSASFSVVKNVVLIEGTKRADHILVIESSAPGEITVSVTIDGHTSTTSTAVRNSPFRTEGPTRVRIHGGKGDDVIRFRTDTFAPVTPVIINGGLDDDTITVDGPRHVTRVRGGPGADVITATPGNGDTLVGGTGADRLQTFTEQLSPDDPDYVPFLDAPQQIAGDDGSHLSGGPGRDTLIGSVLDDTLVGGPGRDRFIMEGGTDAVTASPKERVD